MGVGRRLGNRTNYTKRKKRDIVPYREGGGWEARQDAGLASGLPHGKVTLPEPGKRTCPSCGCVLNQSAQDPQTDLPGENMPEP